MGSVNDEPRETVEEGPVDGSPPPSSAYRSGPEEGTPPDPASAAVGPTDAGAEVEDDFDALLADVKRERDEYLDLARRAKADFENYRKRASRDATEAERRGRAAFARELIPSLDNLERALAAADHGSELARGVELVHGELQATLARAGVEPFDPRGERFDPNLHEAISTQPATDGVEPGTVIETLDRGYRIGEQLLRPARVVVSE